MKPYEPVYQPVSTHINLYQPESTRINPNQSKSSRSTQIISNQPVSTNINPNQPILTLQPMQVPACFGELLTLSLIHILIARIYMEDTDIEYRMPETF